MKPQMINTNASEQPSLRPKDMPRVLPHPGPRSERRFLTVPTRAQTVTRELRSGELLIDELKRVTIELGAVSSSVTFLSGSLSPLHYCIPAEGHGQYVVWFSAERITQDASLVSGTATYGSRDGDPFAHLHLSWKDEQNVLLGGHLWPTTRVGSPPALVRVVGLYDAEWGSINDPETLMPTFRPYALSPKQTTRAQSENEDGQTVSAMVARILPGEDITKAVLEVARKAGFVRAEVAVGTGSLIGACYRDPSTGEVTIVDGPANEVFDLAGTIDTRADAKDHVLTCAMVDRAGEVHRGTLVPGENPVAVTFELTITEA